MMPWSIDGALCAAAEREAMATGTPLSGGYRLIRRYASGFTMDSFVADRDEAIRLAREPIAGCEQTVVSVETRAVIFRNPEQREIAA